MLSIFSKKTYLADLLEGFIDFHNHILPGIDDGAQNIDDSQELIREFKNLGISRLVATPHVMGDFYPNTPKSILKALDLVNSKLKDNFQIQASAEYMMDQNFLDILKKKEIIPIVKETILVEMSFFQQPINLHAILFSIQNNSLTPILAHPERYAYLHGRDLNAYSDLKTRGCKFQLNMLSLSGHYGEAIQRMAVKLLENQMIDFLCTDAHKLEHMHKVKQIKLNKKHSELIKPILENNKRLFA
ncbi:histidinol phosphatase [Gramella sp. BOM4]|nr:histidinol phosphatase [Christiangramia bathymodioli]